MLETVFFVAPVGTMCWSWPGSSPPHSARLKKTEDGAMSECCIQSCESWIGVAEIGARDIHLNDLSCKVQQQLWDPSDERVWATCDLSMVGYRSDFPQKDADTFIDFLGVGVFRV